jgi:hypothetical protein
MRSRLDSATQSAIWPASPDERSGRRSRQSEDGSRSREGLVLARLVDAIDLSVRVRVERRAMVALTCHRVAGAPFSREYEVLERIIRYLVPTTADASTL